jgi:transcriptional regulator with XRE-family HTH domain
VEKVCPLRRAALFLFVVVVAKQRLEEMVKRTTRLEEERTRQGLTLREAANRAGVSYSLLNRWEQRITVPRTDHALNVARAFDLTFEDLCHDFGIVRVPRAESREENVIA